MQTPGSRRLAPGLTERGKGQLFVGPRGPYDAYYELAPPDSPADQQFEGKVGASPEATSELIERGEGRLQLDRSRMFAFDVCEVLPDRGAAGMASTARDGRPVVVRVSGSVSSNARVHPASYHDWNDLFAGKMPWLSEHGRNRIRAATLEARVTFRRERDDPERRPDGLRGSERLPAKICGHVFEAVATEFDEAGKLDAQRCAEELPEIAYQALELSDPALGPHPDERCALVHDHRD